MRTILWPFTLLTLCLVLPGCVSEPAPVVVEPIEDLLPSAEPDSNPGEGDDGDVADEPPEDEALLPPEGYEVSLYGFQVSPDPVTTHATFSVSLTAPAEAELSYLWCLAGVTIGTGQSVAWTHRGLPGTYELRVEAVDQYGLQYTAETLLEISSPHPWPAYQRDAQHSGHSPFPGAATGGAKWDIEFMAYSTPLVGAGDIIYVIGMSGTSDDGWEFIPEHEGIALLTPDGQLSWLDGVPLSEGALTKALSADDVLYIAHQEGVVAVDLNGTERWRWEPEGVVEQGGRVLVIAPDGTVCRTLRGDAGGTGPPIWKSDVEFSGRAVYGLAGHRPRWNGAHCFCAAVHHGLSARRNLAGWQPSLEQVSW